MKKNISINAIIFDFGGVILNIDYKKVVEEFAKLGIDNFDSFYSQHEQQNLFDEFEMGFISPTIFRKRLNKIFNKQITDNELDYAWNSILIDLPESRIKLLEKVKNNYKIFLLSNTNKIHYDSYIKQLIEIGYDDFNQIFEKAYFSFRMGLKKPDIKIFEQVFKEQNLEIDKTLFIDDSQQHIESAKNLGLQTYLLKKEENITMLFNENYCLKPIVPCTFK